MCVFKEYRCSNDILATFWVRISDRVLQCCIYLFIYVCVLLTLNYFAAVQYDEHLTQLEKDIKAAQEAALDAVETDSIFTGTSVDQGDMSKSQPLI